MTDAARPALAPAPTAADTKTPCPLGKFHWIGSVISRVLSRTVIHLGHVSPRGSSSLPGSDAGHAMTPLFGLAAGGVCLAATCCHARGALLPHRFTITGDGLRRLLGCLLSVALSVGSRLPGITWHPALCSPDFPPWARRHHSDRLPDADPAERAAWSLLRRPSSRSDCAGQLRASIAMTIKAIQMALAPAQASDRSVARLAMYNTP